MTKLPDEIEDLIKKHSNKVVKNKEERLSLFKKNLKKCSRCKEIKPLDDFSPSTNKFYLIPFSSICKSCGAEKQRERYNKSKQEKEWKKLLKKQKS